VASILQNEGWKILFCIKEGVIYGKSHLWIAAGRVDQSYFLHASVCGQSSIFFSERSAAAACGQQAK
jgi:hypothetical protein